MVGEIPFLIVQGETEFDARKLLGDVEEGTGKVGRKPDKRAAAAEWLTTYLAQNNGAPVKSGLVIEDAKQNQITTRTLRNAADDMGIIKTPPGGGKNVTWELPAPLLKLALGGSMMASAPRGYYEPCSECSGQVIASKIAGMVKCVTCGLLQVGDPRSRDRDARPGQARRHRVHRARPR